MSRFSVPSTVFFLHNCLTVARRLGSTRRRRRPSFFPSDIPQSLGVVMKLLLLLFCVVSWVSLAIQTEPLSYSYYTSFLKRLLKCQSKDLEFACSIR